MKTKFKIMTFFALILLFVSTPSCLKKMDHSGNISSVAFGPEGKILASGSKDFGFENDFIRLWDVKTGKEIKTLQGHSRGVTSIAFSPDGEILASGGIDSFIKLWDVKTGVEIKTLQGHSRGVTSIAFSPDGEILASGGKEIISAGGETIKLWNVKSGNKIEAFWAHFGNVYSIAFSPDGEILVSGGEGRSVKLWDVKMCEEIKSLRVNYSSGVASLALGPEGKILASASGKFIKLFNMQKNKLRKIITNLTKFYHEDFKADIFSLKGTRWLRFQSDENQISVNEKNELEINFDKKYWIGAYYVFPQYLANGIYEFTMLVRAEKQNCQINIYDSSTKRLIFLTKINPSKEYKECFFRAKMPEEEDHSIWLYFHQDEKEEIGGKFFIKNLKILHRHISKD